MSAAFREDSPETGTQHIFFHEGITVTNVSVIHFTDEAKDALSDFIRPFIENIKRQKERTTVVGADGTVNHQVGVILDIPLSGWKKLLARLGFGGKASQLVGLPPSGKKIEKGRDFHIDIMIQYSDSSQEGGKNTFLVPLMLRQNSTLDSVLKGLQTRAGYAKIIRDRASRR